MSNRQHIYRPIWWLIITNLYLLVHHIQHVTYQLPHLYFKGYHSHVWSKLSVIEYYLAENFDIIYALQQQSLTALFRLLGKLAGVWEMTTLSALYHKWSSQVIEVQRQFLEHFIWHYCVYTIWILHCLEEHLFVFGCQIGISLRRQVTSLVQEWLWRRWQMMMIFCHYGMARSLQRWNENSDPSLS